MGQANNLLLALSFWCVIVRSIDAADPFYETTLNSERGKEIHIEDGYNNHNRPFFNFYTYPYESTWSYQGPEGYDHAHDLTGYQPNLDHTPRTPAVNLRPPPYTVPAIIVQKPRAESAGFGHQPLQLYKPELLHAMYAPPAVGSQETFQQPEVIPHFPKILEPTFFEEKQLMKQPSFYETPELAESSIPRQQSVILSAGAPMESSQDSWQMQKSFSPTKFLPSADISGEKLVYADNQQLMFPPQQTLTHYHEEPKRVIINEPLFPEETVIEPTKIQTIENILEEKLEDEEKERECQQQKKCRKPFTGFLRILDVLGRQQDDIVDQILDRPWDRLYRGHCNCWKYKYH